MYTCVGSSSYILGNLKNAFDYVGVMGASGTVLKDYVKIEWPYLSGSPDSNNVLIKFYYTKVGAAVNPQYQIVKAVAETKSSTAS